MQVGDNSRMSASIERIGLAVLDTDSRIARVLAQRASELGWRSHRLEAAPSAEELARRRVNALVLDPAMLGQEPRAFLERLTVAAPDW
jgi:hypothetical protein